MATSEQILKTLLERDKNVTNINNINYNNNINNSTTSLIADSCHNQADESLCSPVGIASREALSPEGFQPKEIQFTGGSELPHAWRGVKWDIYQNPKAGARPNLKVKMSVIKQDRTTIGLTASMNSPHDRLWRGVLDTTTAHWQTVKEHYQDYQQTFGRNLTHWRASKFYLNRKQGSVDQFAIFLHFTESNYCVRLFANSQIFDYAIPKSSYNQLTERQLNGNQIASAFYGKTQVRLIDPKELGLL